jgi:hypothetical protein
MSKINCSGNLLLYREEIPIRATAAHTLIGYTFFSLESQVLFEFLFNTSLH